MALDPSLTEFSTTSPNPMVIDYNDVETGLGYVDFYAMKTYLAAGAEQILSDQAEYSSDIATTRVAAGTTTFTFKSSGFNRVRTVRGTAIFSCGIGGLNSNITVTARLQKYNSVGPVTTNLSDVITSSVYSPGGVAAGMMILLQLPLTETIIAEGEALILLVTLATDGIQTGEIGHDPQGRDGAFVTAANQVTSVMKVAVPFRVE